jgi:hypothetical protein
MANEELNQLIKAAREAAFFIRSIDGYENSKIANDLSTLAEKVEKQKLLAIGRLAARVVYRNSKAAEQPRAVGQLPLCPECGETLLEDDRRWECVNESCGNCR